MVLVHDTPSDAGSHLTCYLKSFYEKVSYHTHKILDRHNMDLLIGQSDPHIGSVGILIYSVLNGTGIQIKKLLV